MRVSEILVLAYLGYLVLAAWARSMSHGRRLTVVTIAAIDAAAISWIAGQGSGWSMAGQHDAWRIVRDWQPPLQILIGYWLSGLFVQAPMPRVEAWLSHWDRRVFDGPRAGTGAPGLGLGRAITRSPRVALELCEAAYLSVYLVLPLGFGVARMIDPGVDADRYWSLVTLAELACYGALPWIQTRPPRALGDHMEIEQRRLSARRLNDAILRRGSIQVNTCPSGHAAGALATALAVAHVSPIAGLAFVVMAAGVVTGSVVGRYHYAADSIAGVMVALGAWIIFR